jgi:hypothetical protein
LNTIESRIHEQKDKIKEAQRVLSRLQDEARKKDKPQWYKVVGGCKTYEIPPNIDSMRIDVRSNKLIDFDKIKSAIESISATPSEPKSYVDWNKIEDKYKWVAIDKGGTVSAFTTRPHIATPVWVSGREWAIVNEAKYMFHNLPDWDKSLIHRPGAKE